MAGQPGFFDAEERLSAAIDFELFRPELDRALQRSDQTKGDRLFTFLRLSAGQCETAAMLFCMLLASSQITLRKGDGWQTLAESPMAMAVDLAA